MVPALLMANAVNAAEIYNNNGNKLDLYGKVDGLHYFSDDTSEDGDQTYARFGIKGETQIASELTGYGQWEYNIQANTTEKEGANSWTRLAFAGLKFADYGSLDYGRNYGVVYDSSTVCISLCSIRVIMKTPVLAKALITAANVNWRGKMATVSVSPATTILIWGSA